MTKRTFQTIIIWLIGIGIFVISCGILPHWRRLKYPFYYLIVNSLPILIFGGLCLFTSKQSSREIRWLMWIAIIILLIIEFSLFARLAFAYKPVIF